MKCPFCGGLKDKVTDSRATEDNTEIRRRRECLTCHRRFTTYERLEESSLIVVKRDGSRQTFDREKLIHSIMKSCIKRPISTKTIENIVDGLESEARNAFQREISSQEIGEKVLAKLRDIDDVAYIRFASVYRDFDNIESFMQELEELQQKASLAQPVPNPEVGPGVEPNAKEGPFSSPEGPEADPAGKRAEALKGQA